MHVTICFKYLDWLFSFRSFRILNLVLSYALMMQVGQFVNCLVEARSELQHKYVEYLFSFCDKYKYVEYLNEYYQDQ